jgi:hypothetical protein
MDGFTECKLAVIERWYYLRQKILTSAFHSFNALFKVRHVGDSSAVATDCIYGLCRYIG